MWVCFDALRVLLSRRLLSRGPSTPLRVTGISGQLMMNLSEIVTLSAVEGPRDSNLRDSNALNASKHTHTARYTKNGQAKRKFIADCHADRFPTVKEVARHKKILIGELKACAKS